MEERNMKYFGGCDVGSTYTKAVILDENGKMVADTTIRSKINYAASVFYCFITNVPIHGELMRRSAELPAFHQWRNAS